MRMSYAVYAIARTAARRSSLPSNPIRETAAAAKALRRMRHARLDFAS